MVNLISCQCNTMYFIKNSKAAVFEEKELYILRSVFVWLGLNSGPDKKG